MQSLADNGALETASDAESLAAAVGLCLRDAALRAEAGAAGLSVVNRNRGATQRVVAFVAEYLEALDQLASVSARTPGPS